MMRFHFRLILCGLLMSSALPAFSQEESAKAPLGIKADKDSNTTSPTVGTAAQLPDAPAQQEPAETRKEDPGTTVEDANKDAPPGKKAQPKRILGIMPNFRAVSAGAIPPPPTPKQAFIIATKNSFDYLSFIFVGLTSMIAEGQDAHPSLGMGVGGYWGYYWARFPG